MIEGIFAPLRKAKKILCKKKRFFLEQRKARNTLKRYLRTPKGKKVYIWGTSEHTNLGDSAIVLAQKFFLERCGVPQDRIKELPFSLCEKSLPWIAKYLPRDGLICFIGGGNMGDQWFWEEQIRQDAIGKLKQRAMIVFPQTLHYSDTYEGQAKRMGSIPYYNRPNMVLVAREQVSFEEMKSLYPKAEVIMTPDIVLSTTAQMYGVEKRERNDILLCFRNDPERALSEEDHQEIESFVKRRVGTFRRTDTHSQEDVNPEERLEFVREKMQEFAGAKLVLTDRLHGMVFSALTETPCVVFGNYNHKVFGTYEWIKELPYIRYVTSVEDAQKAVDDLLAQGESMYDTSSWIGQFDKLTEKVKTNVFH